MSLLNYGTDIGILLISRGSLSLPVSGSRIMMAYVCACAALRSAERSSALPLCLSTFALHSAMQSQNCFAVKVPNTKLSSAYLASFRALSRPALVVPGTALMRACSCCILLFTSCSLACCAKSIVDTVSLESDGGSDPGSIDIALAAFSSGLPLCLSAGACNAHMTICLA